MLDLACGAGRHTRFFLRRGHAVTAVDRDVEGLSDLAGTANLDIVQADLEDGSPWPLPGQRFGAVVVTNYHWRPLLPLLVACLEEDGILLYETFAVGDEAYRRPARPEFLLRPGELDRGSPRSAADRGLRAWSRSPSPRGNQATSVRRQRYRAPLPAARLTVRARSRCARSRWHLARRSARSRVSSSGIFNVCIPGSSGPCPISATLARLCD